jgi:dTDP-4-amino-4,6-dideoxy-D-galactose acyltransferase
MEQKIDADLLAQRASDLFFYSPYNFLRDIPTDLQQQLFGVGRIADFKQAPHNHILTVGEGKGRTQLLYSALAWDSEFFGTPTYRLHTGLFAQKSSLTDRVIAVQQLQAQLADNGDYYCFSEIPTEDTALLQTLTASGWRLVESRLLFYHDTRSGVDQPRFPVRQARFDEAELIGNISAEARNPYDRFHADAWFGQEKADAFLARYANASVSGYCDAVLVPDEAGLPVDSFLAISDLQADAAALGVGMSRVVLTAVGPQNRGWHLRLVSETIQRARSAGARYVLMTTQTTNRAVFRTCEKLGFKLGGSSHVLAYHAGPGAH